MNKNVSILGIKDEGDYLCMKKEKKNFHLKASF